MNKSVLFLILAGLFQYGFGQTLILDLSGIRNREGCIRLAFFTDPDGFKTEHPNIEKVVEKTNVKNGCLTVQLDSLPPGRYGIALLDDENRNGKLDYTLFLPREGVGFSGYEHSGIRKPHFEDFSFFLKKHATFRIPIRLTYY
jgi:uncharacterized protein (DUF2141 family)